MNIEHYTSTWLKREMSKRGITSGRQLAAKCGLGINSVCDHISGKRRMSAYSRAKYDQFFDSNPENKDK